ncbi:TCF3 fusion partner homolog [Suncus etruscus]|uniref:TCF3 fusion partner homolog n=1 Tax=Suncus etruscus TaxID=109475 RepID=UPI00210F2551|nr:TCF3 fusion partner homolog [Suncus etruscus]
MEWFRRSHQHQRHQEQQSRRRGPGARGSRGRQKFSVTLSTGRQADVGQVRSLGTPGVRGLMRQLRAYGCGGLRTSPQEARPAFPGQRFDFWITRRLQQECRFLMRVLDSYGDDYRAGQFTFVLEDEGSQGTDAPTPSNTENEPPEKDGPSPPRRTPIPRESSSPAPGEGPRGRKRRRAPHDGRRGGASLTPELAPIKVEEDFGLEADEALDSGWVSQEPDKLLPYPTLASPSFD